MKTWLTRQVASSADDKMIYDKMDKNCNKAGGIDLGHMSITGAERIEHSTAVLVWNSRQYSGRK